RTIEKTIKYVVYIVIVILMIYIVASYFLKQTITADGIIQALIGGGTFVLILQALNKHKKKKDE
ncbi:hypothetical protein DRN76_04075, partial [Methanosarcinales archaeon]